MDTREEVPSLAGNAAWMVAANVVGKLASFALVVVVARALGPDHYGYFALALAFIPLLLQLGRWGIDLATIRELAADRGALSGAFVNGLVARTLLALAATVGSLAIMPFFVHGREPMLAVAIVAVALFLDELSFFLGDIFVAFERMRFNAMVLVVNRIVSTALTVAVVALGGGLVLVCITYLIGSLGGLVSGWVILVRYFPPIHRRDYRRKAVRALFRQGAPYGVANFLNFGVFRIDSVLLQPLQGATAVGLYNAAYRFFEPLLFATWSLADAALPRLVRERKEGAGNATFESCLAALLAFHLPIVVAAPFTARWLVNLVFGERFEPAVPAVLWLSSAACLYAVAHLARVASIAAGRRSELVWIAGTVLGFNVIANLIVIPSHGFVGAAVVTFATEAVEATVLLGLYLKDRRRLHLRPVLVPLIASGVMLIVMTAVDWRALSAALLGAGVFAAALVGTGLVLLGDDTRRILSRARPRRLRAVRGDVSDDVTDDVTANQ